MFQTVATWVIVAVTAAFAVRKVWMMAKSKSGGGCGCSGCPMSEGHTCHCGKAQPPSHPVGTSCRREQCGCGEGSEGVHRRS